MFYSSIKELLLFIFIGLIVLSCDDNHCEGPICSLDDGLAVFVEDETVAYIVVESHEDSDDSHDDDHADIGGFELREDNQGSYTYRQLSLTTDGLISLSVGQAKEFSVHFLEHCGDIPSPTECGEFKYCEWDSIESSCEYHLCVDITNSTECGESEHCEWNTDGGSCEEEIHEEHCEDITNPTECGESEHCEWNKDGGSCEEETHEDHGMHIEIEGINAGTTEFQIVLVHNGHSDYTSLPISVSVE